jgi:hypothetical protein
VVGHHRNHERLRDRLIEANRQRPVQVGIVLNLDRHKLVPRDFGYSCSTRSSSVLLLVEAATWSVIALIAPTICRRCSSKNSTLMGTSRPHSLSPRADDRYRETWQTSGRDAAFSSGPSSTIPRIPVRTCIDPADFLHKRLQLRWGNLATGNLPRCSRLLIVSGRHTKRGQFDVTVVVSACTSFSSEPLICRFPSVGTS